MSLIELSIALGLFGTILTIGILPIKSSVTTLQSNHSLHSGLHFVDASRTRAIRTQGSVSFSPDEIHNIPILSSIESSNKEGFKFSASGLSSTPTTLSIPSGGSISILISSIGRFNLYE